MKRMKMLRTILLACTGLGLVSGSAFGATISYSNSVTSLTDFTDALALQMFNPALGTLTGVTITLTDNESITALSFMNNSNAPVTFGYDTATKITASDSLPIGAFSALTVDVFNSGAITVGAHATTTIAPPTQTASGTTTAVATAGQLAAYEGAGTFNVTGTTLTGTTLSGAGGNIASNQTTSAQLIAQVTYTYSASTPEPASMALMGTGLALVGWFGRKRLAKSNQ